MTLLEYLDKDKDKLLASFAQAQTAEKVIPIVEAEYDRLLYEYNEDARNDHERRYVAGMLQTARMAAPLLDCIGETKIWEQGGKLLNDEKKKVRLLAIILVVAGILLLAAITIVICGIDAVLNRITDKPVLIGAFALAVCFLFFGGFFFIRKKKASYSEKQLKDENRVDPQRIYQAMHAVLMIVDRNLNEALAAEEAEKQISDEDVELLQGSSELSLYSDLLEAARSGDGQYALDQLSKVAFFLHQKGIDVLEYSDDKRSFFDTIPGERNETIRPALVKDGHLLKKGVVSGGQQ